MKQTIISAISIIFCSLSLSAQNSIDDVLLEIEKNNTTLLALRKNADAKKLGNKTGIYHRGRWT